MKMELTKNHMAEIKKTVADMCQLEGFPTRLFVPIEGDTFDDLVKWVTSEMEINPVERDRLRSKPSISSLIASLMVLLSYPSYEEIPSDKYELGELKELFDFIESVDDEETLMDIFDRWAEYETPVELLIKEGFRKTA